MLSLDISAVQELIDSGFSTSRAEISKRVRLLKKALERVPKTTVIEVLDEILLHEQARIVSSYLPLLHSATNSEEVELVLDAITEESDESCHEIVFSITGSRHIGDNFSK